MYNSNLRKVKKKLNTQGGDDLGFSKYPNGCRFLSIPLRLLTRQSAAFYSKNGRQQVKNSSSTGLFLLRHKQPWSIRSPTSVLTSPADGLPTLTVQPRVLSVCLFSPHPKTFSFPLIFRERGKKEQREKGRRERVRERNIDVRETP